MQIMQFEMERTRTAVEAYLRGVSDLDALQESLAEITWDNPHPPQPALAAELLIAEFTGGHRSERSLRRGLASIIRSVAEPVGSPAHA
jgi:hypothetical protein